MPIKLNRFCSFLSAFVFIAVCQPWSPIAEHCSGTLAAAEGMAGTRPNIVLIMTDDQGYAPVGRHGHPWLKTPSMDKLYDTSTRFTRFLVSPTCAPTRSAIMTGRHPLKNGVTHTILERERLTLDATTLPQAARLRNGNFRQVAFGR
jgi:arylsulfatase A-like enzyme